MGLTYEVYELLEEEVGKEKAQKIAKILEEALDNIEQKAKDQKPILKSELKDELTKELVTKYELEGLRTEMNARFDSLNKEMDLRFDHLREEMRFYIIILGLLIIFLNHNSLELMMKIIQTILQK